MIETLLLGMAVALKDSLVPVSGSNFTKSEIGTIASEMGQDMTMRLSPSGNPIVKHRSVNGNAVIFSFYKREDGIIIRRRLGYDNPFGSGNVLNAGKPFSDINKAMAYFKTYKEKYPNSIIR